MNDGKNRRNTVVALEQVLEGASGEADPQKKPRERAKDIHKRLAANLYLKHLGYEFRLRASHRRW
jgi:hypothetical protein